MWLKNRKRGRKHVWLFALLFLSAHVNSNVGFFESEPNNEPQDFEQISGAITLYGVLESNDQDGYLWTVSDEDARKRWRFELHGVPSAALTQVNVMRPEYADNGDVVKYNNLFKMGTRDGTRPSIHEGLIFEPGEYVLGFSGAGLQVAPEVGETEVEETDDRGGYRFHITESKLSLTRDPGQQSDIAEAHSVRPGREFATFETDPLAWYRFDFEEADRANRWAISVRTPVGRRVEASLHDEQGRELLSQRANDKGSILFAHLVPPVGVWYLKVSSRESGMVQAITSEAIGLHVSGEEAEPNNRRRDANQVDLSEPVTGRIGGDDSEDYLAFNVPETDGNTLQTLMLESSVPGKMTVCLRWMKGKDSQCKTGTPPLSFPSLGFSPGDWYINIRKAREQPYRITLTDDGPAKPGSEVEPNDQLSLATGVSEKLRIRGQFSGLDTDHYQMIITEEAQLWRFQVNGDGLDSIAYLDGRGRARVSIKAERGARRVRLDNVFLPPGRHTIRLKGQDGNYMLLARPLGPPVAVEMPATSAVAAVVDGEKDAKQKVSVLWNPDGEIEPNDTYNMQRLAVGQTRTGSLPYAEDEDFYRFFVANDDHLRLTIESPEDGVIHPYLRWYGTQIGSAEKRSAGEVISYQGLLPAGDYVLRLTTPSPSDKPYRLRLERLPRFGCAKDCEPNDISPLRRMAPLPLDLRLQGEAQTWRDSDAYQLPLFEKETAMQLLTETALHRAYLAGPQGERSGWLQYDKALGGYSVRIPAGQQQSIVISGSRGKPYDVQIVFPQGEVSPVTGDLAVDVTLNTEVDSVAAFLDQGQQFAGELKITNNQTQAQDLIVRTATSDARWTLKSAQDKLSLAPGQTVAVPVEVQVPADAWADHSVRLSVMVRDIEGRHVEAWREMEVVRDNTAVNPGLYWPVPESLRGGFNAAWLPFGAQVTQDSPDKVGSPALRDGLVFPQKSMRCCAGTQNWKEGLGHRWTMQLPGDEPLPVAGIALDAFGTNILHAIKRATLLTSLDGVEYQEALRFETQPLLTEQYFALDEAVSARYVQLHIESTFEFPSNNIAMGEWKVLLQPGMDLSNGLGFDIADPAFGGHLVWNLPSVSGAARILIDSANSRTVDLKNKGVAEYVIGFHRTRAAKIRRLEWHYDERSTEERRRFGKVRIWRSTDSPIGPWIQVGEVEMDPAQMSFTHDLEMPEFARFIRFEAIASEGARYASEPGRVRIWEVAGDDRYTSILTEWGEAGGRAFYETTLANAPQVSKAQASTSRQQASDLNFGDVVSNAVSLGKYSHWYKFNVPGDVNTLTFDLAGEPTVRTVLNLQDGSGVSIPLQEPRSGRTPQLHRYEAIVEPDQTLYLNVAEPPRNVVFSWDTSGSVSAYIPRINNSVMVFSGEVQAEHEWVNLLPFGRGMLLSQWTDQATILQTVLNDFRRENESSAAELALYKATNGMKNRAGTKAIVVVTDAITPYFGDLWKPMAEIQPRIFGIGVGGSGPEEQNRFRDWAAVNGGDYRQLRYLGEMDVAFDRASTKMHRPAHYTLELTGEFREAPGPGRLEVESGNEAGGAVALILDASGSMLKRLQGKRRIEIAKEVLTQTVQTHIPAGTPLALRVFGHKEADSCRTDLEIPLGPLDPQLAAEKISDIYARNLARTPIADSLAAIEKDLKGNTSGVVLLVTDGEETCEGDPAAVIEALQSKGFDISLNIVGFAIEDQELNTAFEQWAELGGGRYFGAQDESGLQSAIQQALKVPFSVVDASGETIAAGQVDGEGIMLEAGTYTVVVSGKTQQTIEEVVIQGEDTVVVSLRDAAGS